MVSIVSRFVMCGNVNTAMSKQDEAALAVGALEIRKAEAELDDPRLIHLENVIERGLQTFMDVGSALLEIRDKKLYKPNYKTFELYCRERWKMSQPRAYQLMDAAKVTQNLSTNVELSPNRESQVRPLAKLKPKQQRKVWKAAVQSANGEQPTARQVEAVRDRVKRRRRDELPPYEPKPDEQRALDAIEKQAKKLAEIITPHIVGTALNLDSSEKQRWLDFITPVAAFYKALAGRTVLKHLTFTIER